MFSRLLSIVWRIILCSSLLTGVLVAPAPVARAGTLIVTNNADSGTGSLRNAIAAASNGDTITFDNDYTITLASELEIINKTVTITGAGHHITISGNNAVRVFHVGDYDTAGSGNLTIDHLNIVNGKSTFNGVDLCDGQAVGCGGGLLLDYLTTATVSNCTFLNNDGDIQGGAIYSYYGNPLTVINSTFVNNHALAYAGAIHVFYGSATLTNNTFTGNAATLAGGYGGAILTNWGTVTFRNNIFADNSATNGGNCDNSGGTFNENGGNLVWGDTADCPGVNANPLLGTLGDYGGNVPTIPLLPGSPAINAASANCPAVDARGITRGATCDSGAFESQGFTLTKTGGDNQSTPINTAFATSLAMSVTSAFGEPVNGGKVTITPPGSGASAAISGSPATISGGGVSVNTTANGIVGGPYNVTASTAGATSVNFSLTNLKGNTTTSLTSAPNPSVVGQAVTFTATVTSVSGVPTGTVTFYDNALSFGSGTLTAGGVATLTTTSLTIGTHSPITAIYSGSTNYNSSTSSNYAQTVNKIDTTTSLTSSPNPSAFGQAVTFTATVTAIAPGGGTPIGSITFTIASLSANVPLDGNGQASYLTNTLPVGTYSGTAQYSGAANFNVSNGSLNGGQVVTDTTITGLTALNSSPTHLYNTTYFTATATGSNVTYQWNFGDGQIGSGATTNHLYTATGTYTATITATNGAGSSLATTLVTIDPIKVYLPLILNRY